MYILKILVFYYDSAECLINNREIKKKTGCSLVVNTSYNIRGEQIVYTPTNVFNCFMGTDLDLLSIGNYLLKKGDQYTNLKIDYKKNYELN